MTEVSSLQRANSARQLSTERASDSKSRAVGNMTNVGNFELQPTSVNNPQLKANSNGNQYSYLINLILKYWGRQDEQSSSGKKLINSKDGEIKSKTIVQGQNGQSNLPENNLFNELCKKIDMSVRSSDQIHMFLEEILNAIKLNPELIEFTLKNKMYSGISEQYLHLFVGGDGNGYVSSEDVPYADPVSSKPRDNGLVNSQLSEGEQLKPDEVKSYDATDFALPETNSKRFFDRENPDHHPEVSTANGANVFNNINNDNRVINNYPVYIKNIFNYFEPAPNNVNASSPAEQVLVADYDPAQKAMVQHLPEGSL